MGISESDETSIGGYTKLTHNLEGFLDKLFQHKQIINQDFILFYLLCVNFLRNQLKKMFPLTQELIDVF
jgi:hypothetical protein